MIRVILTAAALVALAGLTFGLSYVPLGAAEVPVAMGIAAVKVAVLGAGFLQLLARPASQRLTFVIALVLAATLLSLVVLDTANR
ncbi:MAG: hypothetical protein R3F59_27660 [Myxococcota bacterium]